MKNTEKQLCHDWSTGDLVIYEIEVEVEEKHEPPTDDAPTGS